MAGYNKMPWLHPLDRWIGLTCDCPCEGGKRKIGDSKNLGCKNGRKATFPLHSIDYSCNIESIVNSGLYFDVYNFKPILRCVGCDITITDWVVGGDADFIHRTQNPHCFWLQLRDCGDNIELDIGANYSLPWPHTASHIPFKMPRISPPTASSYKPSLQDSADSVPDASADLVVLECLASDLPEDAIHAVSDEANSDSESVLYIISESESD